MQIDRATFLEVLKDAYSAYYDLAEDAETELPLVFRADYKDLDEHYWFTKSAKVWVNEKNEHAYLFSAPSFDAESVRACVDFALADGLPRVKPHKNHQCTNIKVVFVADTADDELRADIEKTLPKDVPHTFISAVTGDGLMHLKDMIWEALNREI